MLFTHTGVYCEYTQSEFEDIRPGRQVGRPLVHQMAANMENMSASIEPIMPRTANLLACKQWWRVCFLYGDQQKYYRQVYSKAAAQRLALASSVSRTNTTNTITTTSDGKKTNNIAIIMDDLTNAGVVKSDNCNSKSISNSHGNGGGGGSDDNDNDNDSDNENGNDHGIAGIDIDYDVVISNEEDLTNDAKKANNKTLQQQQKPMVLYPLKFETAKRGGGGESKESSLRKSKRFIRSLRGQKKSSTEATTKSPASTDCNETTTTIAAIGDGVKDLKRKFIKATPIVNFSYPGKANTQPSTMNVTTPTTTTTVTTSCVHSKQFILNDPFLFGIDEDHLDDLVNGKHNPYLNNKNYSNNASKQTTTNTIESIEANSNQSSNNSTAIIETKPALPPKRKSLSNTPLYTNTKPCAETLGGGSSINSTEQPPTIPSSSASQNHLNPLRNSHQSNSPPIDHPSVKEKDIHEASFTYHEINESDQQQQDNEDKL